MTPPSSIRWLWTLARKLRAKLEQQTQTTERHLLDADHRVQHAEQAHEATKRALEDERRLRIDAEHALETAQRICTDEQYLRTQAEEQSAVLRQKLLAANTHIADQGAQLRTVQSDLATIRSSRTWRLFAPYRRVRARFSAR
jgi:chromosome segregation ATPase